MMSFDHPPPIADRIGSLVVNLRWIGYVCQASFLTYSLFCPSENGVGFLPFPMDGERLGCIRSFFFFLIIG